MSSPYEHETTTPPPEVHAPVQLRDSAPAVAVGPELVKMLLGALGGVGRAEAAQARPDPTPAFVDALREQLHTHNQARGFLERLVLELRAENAALRAENATLRSRS